MNNILRTALMILFMCHLMFSVVTVDYVYRFGIFEWGKTPFITPNVAISLILAHLMLIGVEYLAYRSIDER